MKNIALAFSGGGFRASAYSLGCLTYLNRLEIDGTPLLENVKYISSTSGGSLTNLVYSSHIFNGRSFQEAYDLLNKEMLGDKLLEEAMHILNTSSAWKGRDVKSRNLINAFSMAYDRIFEQQDFSVFNTIKHKPHLEEICVTSTEFTNGLPFRFQSQHANSSFSKGRLGNDYIYFKKSNIKQGLSIKLADIMASSSCFPSGFEPMIFPKDYANSNVSETELDTALSYKANSFTIDKYNHLNILTDEDFRKKRQFGIMDGGVDDNQAIDAFLKADERRANDNKFDLFISCDVASPFMDGYTLPIQKGKWYDFLSIRALIAIFIILMLWFPILLIADRGVWAPWKYITATVSGMFGALFIILYLLPKIKSLFSKPKPESSWSKLFKKYRWQFAKLSLGFLKQMISSRLKSVFILANDIYLKQIRRMYYIELFANDQYRDHVIQNTIYDLSLVTVSKHKFNPSDAIIAVAEKARNMGTTLWFDEKHEAEKMRLSIIATGQFTTCYNLLRYLEKLKKKSQKQEQKEEAAKSEEATKPEEAGGAGPIPTEPQATPGIIYTPELEELRIKLKRDWKIFCENPFDGLT